MKFLIYILLIAIGIALYAIYENFVNKNNQPENEIDIKDEKLPYQRKYLLTKNEYAFYKTLKEIAEKLGLTILAKVRLADLVDVNSEAEGKEKLKYFAKIKSKHIDFMLCNKENLYPELLIELNDNSHKAEKRAERDDFVSRVLEKTGYKLLFVYGTGDLEQKINECLKASQK